MGWGPTVEPYNVYLNERMNGATMLSIAVGHAADALCYCLGEVRDVAQAYARFARDYREGTHLCPTFEDVVTRHRMLDAIEKAAATGEHQRLYMP